MPLTLTDINIIQLKVKSTALYYAQAFKSLVANNVLPRLPGQADRRNTLTLLYTGATRGTGMANTCRIFQSDNGDAR